METYSYPIGLYDPRNVKYPVIMSLGRFRTVLNSSCPA